MVDGSSRRPIGSAPSLEEENPKMEYFAGLGVSMAETHVCAVARNGAVIPNAKVPSTPADIAAELAQVPRCRRTRDGPDGFDAVPWLEPAWLIRRVRRKSAGPLRR